MGKEKELGEEQGDMKEGARPGWCAGERMKGKGGRLNQGLDAKKKCWGERKAGEADKREEVPINDKMRRTKERTGKKKEIETGKERARKKRANEKRGQEKREGATKKGKEQGKERETASSSRRHSLTECTSSWGDNGSGGSEETATADVAVAVIVGVWWRN